MEAHIFKILNSALSITYIRSIEVWRKCYSGEMYRKKLFEISTLSTLWNCSHYKKCLYCYHCVEEDHFLLFLIFSVEIGLRLDVLLFNNLAIFWVSGKEWKSKNLWRGQDYYSSCDVSSREQVWLGANKEAETRCSL